MRFAFANLMFCLSLTSVVLAGNPSEPIPVTATDGEAGDRFGGAVDLAGNVAIIGAEEDDDLGSDAGSAYVRRFDGTAWIEEAKLLAPDGGSGDEFGTSVGIDGTWAAVGAPKDDDRGSNAGAVHVFRHSGSWTHHTKLFAPDGAAGDSFGSALALDGTTLVVGSRSDDDVETNSGSAHVFLWTGATWTHQRELTAADPTAGAFFGKAVAIDGPIIAVGAYGVDEELPNSGAVYVFRNVVPFGWVQEQRLRPSTPGFDGFFGWSVDVHENRIVAGAPREATGGPSAGAAYAFAWTSAGGWTEEQKLTASDSAGFDEFGRAVAIEDERILVGAHLTDGEFPDMGSAYLFTRGATTWTEDTTIVSPSAYYWDEFGSAVAMSDGRAIVGATEDDDVGNNSGTAFITSLDGVPCTSDLDGSGLVDFNDILTVILEWGPCPGCVSDIDADGIVGFGDIFMVISDWGPCP